MTRMNSASPGEECGQSILETAFMLLVIFMVVFWIVEISGMVYTYATIANAAEEGVRYAVTSSGVVPNDSRIVTRVKNFAGTSLHDVSQVAVQVSLPDGASKPPNRVEITVSYTYVPWLKNVTRNMLVMHAYAQGRMVVE